LEILKSISSFVYHFTPDRIWTALTIILFFHARLVYKSWIPCRLISIAHATTRCLDTQNVVTEVDKELIDCKPRMDRVYLVPVIKNSSHRDGAIYKNKFIREDFWEGDIADRNESKWSKMTKSLFVCILSNEFFLQVYIHVHRLIFGTMEVGDPHDHTHFAN